MAVYVSVPINVKKPYIHIFIIVIIIAVYMHPTAGDRPSLSKRGLS